MSCAIRFANDNLRNNSYGNIYGVSKEGARFRLNISLVTNLKTLPKNLWRPSRKLDEKEKKKKTRMAIGKLFGSNANAIIARRRRLQWNFSFCFI